MDNNDMKLLIELPSYEEVINEETLEFVSYPSMKVYLEHSLYTISLWESKWKQAFLGDKPKTDESMNDYVYFMITGVEDETLRRQIANRIVHSVDDVNKIKDYINNSMSATCFMESSADKKKSGGDVLTSEFFYYMIFGNQIPIEVEHWHLNRLSTLLKVFAVKNNPDKHKHSRREIMADYERINQRNRARFNTKG